MKHFSHIKKKINELEISARAQKKILSFRKIHFITNKNFPQSKSLQILFIMFQHNTAKDTKI